VPALLFFPMTSKTDNQDGFTLVELLIASTMALIITAAAVTFLVSVMHQQPRITSSATAIGNARNAVEKITSDLRVGEKATLLGPSEVKVNARCSQVAAAGNGDCEVTFRCAVEPGATTSSCARSVGSGPAETVITGLTSSEIFCVYPTAEKPKECGSEEEAEPPLYVGVKIELPNYEESNGKNVLEGGAALHNAPGLLKTE
jgi:prepilin-type N-terminal cleavage/methylation domain-containing protein